MDCDKAIEAVFVEDSHDIAEYYLHLRVKGDGQVTKSPDADYYEDGAVVTLTARASEGWQFICWSGDLEGNNYRTKVTMDSDKDITALFEREEEEKDTYSLEIQISGNGRVSKSPDRERYEEGERVTLTANADSGWYFKEWRGDLTGSSSQVSLTMDNNKKVIAVFEKEVQRYRLTVNVLGSGTVSKSPDYNDYDEGTLVTLSASPASGWEFQGWSGDASGIGTTTQVKMDSNKTVTATFKAKQGSGYVLTTKVGNKDGTIIRSPDQGRYSPGTVVTLTAQPAPCYGIHYWMVDGRQTAYKISIEVTMTKDITAIAYFQFTG